MTGGDSTMKSVWHPATTRSVVAILIGPGRATDMPGVATVVARRYAPLQGDSSHRSGTTRVVALFAQTARPVILGPRGALLALACELQPGLREGLELVLRIDGPGPAPVRIG